MQNLNCLIVLQRSLYDKIRLNFCKSIIIIFLPQILCVSYVVCIIIFYYNAVCIVEYKYRQRIFSFIFSTYDNM